MARSLGVVVCACAGWLLAQSLIWPELSEFAWISISCLVVCSELRLSGPVENGFAAGITFWFTLLGWATAPDGATSVGLQLASFTIAILESSYLVAWTYATRLLRSAPLAIAAAALGSLWALEELLRIVGDWAMPYGEIGASQSMTPLGLLGTAVGSPGVSAIVVALAYAVARLFRERGVRPNFALMGAVVFVISVGCLPVTVGWPPGANELTIAAVPQVARSVSEFTSALRAADALRPDLIVFPEGALQFPNGYDEVRKLQSALTPPADIAIGASAEEPAGAQNVAILFSKAGATLYAKQKLVPFGEFIPEKAIFGRLMSLRIDFVPGKDAALWSVDGIHIAPLICFEVAFSNLTREAVAKGADALLVMENNSWFSSAAGDSLQSAVARFRARSLGVDVAVVGTRGTAMVFHPGGQIENTYQGGAGVTALHIASPKPTLYAAWGNYPILLLGAGSVLALLLSRLVLRRYSARPLVSVGRKIIS
jgi:apolipoprotein N-acyltransferase